MGILPFQCYEKFEYDDFCEGCPDLKIKSDIEIMTGKMGGKVVEIYYTCPDIDKCRRISKMFDKKIKNKKRGKI